MELPSDTRIRGIYSVYYCTSSGLSGVVVVVVVLLLLLTYTTVVVRVVGIYIIYDMVDFFWISDFDRIENFDRQQIDI